MKRSNRDMLAGAGTAAVGYATAFAGATGALFAALLTLGVAGELYFWVALVRRLRGTA